MKPGISSTLAQHVAGARYEDLSVGAIEATKKSLLDALGVSLGASGLGEGCDAFAQIAIECGGKQQSTILGYQKKAPAALAAFANGAMAHALDFEDALDGAPVHPNAAVVPAALAVAQMIGGVSGKELILAQAIGCDLVCRLGRALTENLDVYGWYPPPILSAYGATAAAARLLKLNENEVLDAFSLALCQATCSAELKFSSHSVIRAVRDAFAAQTGVVSAQLAGRGVTGFETPFEGKAGFFQLYARGNYDPAVLLQNLGRDFLGEHVSFKPWPACRGTHAFIEGVLTIAREHELAPDDIEEIRLTGGQLQRMLAEPLEQKRKPATAIEAKFSLPFTVAVALIHDDVALEHFSKKRLLDARVLELAHKVSFETSTRAGSVSGDATVRTRGGASYTVEVKRPLGHPDNPIGIDALVRKFRNCAGQARTKLSGASLDGIVGAVMSLEEIVDVGKDLIDAYFSG